ncbi:MAG: TonB-dependent receptor plug domain-containing protein [Bacteroidales bacterium]|nr:TonB-dependent receptor plug domain-containing protein [Bacteroidales bacterium]
MKLTSFSFFSFVPDCELSRIIVWANTTGIRKSNRNTDGEPIPGVSVIVKGTNTGTATDIDGNYILEVPPGSTLVFSSVGMSRVEVPVDNQTVINVNLEPDVVGLEEVVVTALGISREKKRLGYSVTEVDNEEFTQGTGTNLTNALSGKVAGVQVSGGTGQPGSSTNVVLRGYATIGRETQPLYVVDGVQVTNMEQNFSTNGADVNRTVDFGNGINDINAQDIENISILRGSAATALYGSAGANGVILITTKRGSALVKGGKPLISVNSITSFSSVLRYPMFQSTFGQGWDGHFASEENGSWGPRFTNEPRLWGNEVGGRQLYKDFSFLEDQLSDFYVTGNIYDNTIAISGAGDFSTYYLSYNNVSDNGVVPGEKDKYVKNSFKLSATKQMGFIDASANFIYINKETNTIPTGQGQGGMSNLFDDLLQHPTDISLVDMENYRDPTSFYHPNNYFSPYLWNPYFSINNTSNVANVDRLIANTSLDLSILKAYRMKGTLRFGGDVSNTFGHNYDGKFTLSDNSVNKGQQNDIDGYYREFQRNVRLYNLDALITGGVDAAEWRT